MFKPEQLLRAIGLHMGGEADLRFDLQERPERGTILKRPVRLELSPRSPNRTSLKRRKSLVRSSDWLKTQLD